MGKLPSLKELADLVVHAEMDKDPYVIFLMRSLALDYDENIVRDVLERIQPALIKKSLNPDPFAPNPTAKDVYGNILIGKVKQTDASFGLNLDELGEHTLIAGRAGAGKTTLIYIMLIQLLKHRIPFWAFDFKQDYRHLAKAGNVLVFNWETFRFNPLRPPIAVHPQVWMQAFTNVFCQVYWLLSGSKSIILEHIKRLYTDYGVFSGSNVYPSMFDLYESLKDHKLERKYGREAGFLESAKNRVNECLLSFGDIFDCDKGFSIEELLSKNVVFELEGLLAENQAFILNIILRYVFQYRISNNQRSSLRHVFLFDEAKTVYSKKREFSKELGVSEIAQFTSTIREFGEGLVVADQMPTELADSIKANTYTVICMSQSGGPNVFEMTRALGLTREQAEACRTLQADKTTRVFEAIVKLNGKWLNPFLIQVLPYQVVKDVSNADLQRFMAPLLEALNQRLIPRTDYKLIMEAKQKEELQREAEARKQRQEEAEQREKVEGNVLIQILTNIRDHPFIDQKARIQMLGLASSSSTADKYFKELVAKGFITVHRIGLGRGHSTKVLYEITDNGREFARMNKFVIPGKGDFKHKFWQYTIRKFFESLGFNAVIEKRYGFKNVDVGFEISGRKTAVEVELSSEHLIENIQRDFEAGCDLIIIAVPNKRSINSYKKKIQFYNKDFLDRVEFRVLTDFL
jgi:DNA-binding PadR family transcriptional regulator